MNNRKKVINNYRSPPVFRAGPGTRPPPYALTKPAPNLPGSSTKRAVLVDGEGKVAVRPPEKGRTFQENGPWHGRSPGKTQDLPGKRALAWKVPRKNAGPSGKKNAGPSRKMAPGMEGPPEKRRTFRENGPWHGRSWGRCRASPEKGWFFGTELLIGRGNPRKVPFSWMGLESSAGGAA